MVFKCNLKEQLSVSGNKLFWHHVLHPNYELWYTAACLFSEEEIQLKLNELTYLEKLNLGPSYSFLLWDMQKNKYHVQVDEFASCPLFYLYSEGDFYVADLFKELVDVFPSTLTMNAVFIQDYLQAFSSTKQIHTQTIYVEIQRILPQHYVFFCLKNGLSSVHYLKNWLPRDCNKQSEEIIQDTRALFTSSIHLVAASHKQVAANLSGGLDSSSIVSTLLAYGVNVQALYAVVEGKDADEFAFVEEMEAYFSRFCTDKIHIPTASYSAVQRSVALMAQPDWMAAPSVLHFPLFDAVRTKGTTVFFSGHGGDSIIGTNEFYSTAIWEKRDFHALTHWKKSRHFRLKYYRSAWKNAANLWRKKGIAFFLYAQMSCLLRGLLPSNILGSTIKLIFQIPRKESAILPSDLKRLTIPIGLNAEQRKHWEGHFSVITIAANELLYTVGRAFGTKVFFPFQDLRLFEKALCFDSEKNFALGARRGLLREAMKDILPEKIRQRTSKATFMTYLVHSLRNILHEFPENREMTPLERLYISSDDWMEWNRTKKEILQNADVSMKQIDKCSKITYLLIWLKSFSSSI